MAIRFPVFTSLDIEEYGLFPGPVGATPSGFHEVFDPGLTLLLGTNGLGKTTLVSVLYRMLTGPTEIPALLAEGRPLGTASLEPRVLQTPQRQMFARRVADNASRAKARLALRLGSRKVIIERRLQNIELLAFSVDGSAQIVDDEERTFQRLVPDLVGVGTFADWILLLRHLIFYFEDRRSLVWDPTAQRQLLRLLFLPADVASQWTKGEREIVELDSDKRNLQSVLGRQEAQLASKEVKAGAGSATLAELKAVQVLRSVLLERQEAQEAQLVPLDASRQAARLRYLRAEQARDADYRKYEQAKLLAIETRFPQQSETARFIYAHLMTNEDCLVCGNRAEIAAAAFNLRAQQKHCVVCDTPLESSMTVAPSRQMADKRVTRDLRRLGISEDELKAAREELDNVEAEYAAKLDQLRSTNHEVAAAEGRIDELHTLLPPSETELRDHRSTLTGMRLQVREMDAQLRNLRTAFKEFVERVGLDVAGGAEQVADSFDGLAKGFLSEDCRLTWTAVEASLGQSGGSRVAFPAFQVDLSGSNFSAPVRRRGPEQVSESQREFIDLAFRMALMAAAGTGEGATMVIDAPESSLDAVFTPRAAEVLLRFASALPDNRLIVASNLVEGRLIPALLNHGAADGRTGPKIVNLLNLAVPTAAVRQHRQEYDRVFAELTNPGVPRGS